MPEFKVKKIPNQLDCSEDSVLILPEIDRHCLTLRCSYAIKTRTITSFRLTSAWKSFLFDLDYNIRGYFSPISDTGLCLLSIGRVGGCLLSHFMKCKPLNHAMFQCIRGAFTHIEQREIAESWYALQNTESPFQQLIKCVQHGCSTCFSWRTLF